MDILGGTTGYVVLKSLHVLAAATWVGGAIAINVLATRIRKANEPAVLARFAKETEWVGTHIYLPASLSILGLGIWMVATSGWNFTDLWIELGILGIIATVITGAFFLGPTSKKVGELIEERGSDDPQVQETLARLFSVARIDLVVLILVIIDMVAKPVL